MLHYYYNILKGILKMTPLKKFQHGLKKQNIDLSIITSPQLINYLIGYASEPNERILSLFVSDSQAILFTPSLESDDAKSIVSIPVYDYDDGMNPWKVINEDVLSHFHPIHTVGIDYESLTVDKYFSIQSLLPKGHYQDIGSMMNQIKVIKSKEEKEALMAAGKLADQAVQIGINTLKVGITETEVVAKIEYEMKKLGVSEMSFPTMVLFGDHAGSPHGEVSDRKLKENEFVLFDLGVIYNGYASDMTRTVFFGSETEISDRQKEIYQVVLDAQVTPQQQVKPGILASNLDQLSRQIIEDAGYGHYFIHRLGHGIGQTAHEFPSIDSSNQDRLEAGMCFSIEPGIYIPGEIGIRIEDCVYLTDEGAESFTQFDKSLLYIDVK